MGRRHQGGRPHRPNGHARPLAPLAASPSETGRPRPDSAVPPSPARAEPARPADPVPTVVPADPSAPSLSADEAPAGHPADLTAAGSIAVSATAGCTAPQLRRFIKSRPYVPMHELRRRFGINGVEDEVSAVDLPDCRIFVGLPEREGALLGELLRAGDVGYELSLDPRTPIVVGLYPMRPVPRT